MIRIIVTVLGIVFFLMNANFILAEEEALLGVIRQIVNKEILPLAKEVVIISAVKEANKEAVMSLDKILELDKKWRETEGIDGWIGGFLNNRCANYLKKIQENAAQSGKSLYSEIFIMDRQGNIVAETNKTSDYWQGDEDKFIKSYADGIGYVFIDDPSFDLSTGDYLIQVSVPIVDPNTQTAIGAMTVGIDLDVFAKQFIY